VFCSIACQHDTRRGWPDLQEPAILLGRTRKELCRLPIGPGTQAWQDWRLGGGEKGRVERAEEKPGSMKRCGEKAQCMWKETCSGWNTELEEFQGHDVRWCWKVPWPAGMWRKWLSWWLTKLTAVGHCRENFINTQLVYAKLYHYWLKQSWGWSF
jgi:hypothetical protein